MMGGRYNTFYQLISCHDGKNMPLPCQSYFSLLEENELTNCLPLECLDRYVEGLGGVWHMRNRLFVIARWLLECAA